MTNSQDQDLQNNNSPVDDNNSEKETAKPKHLSPKEQAKLLQNALDDLDVNMDIFKNLQNKE